MSDTERELPRWLAEGTLLRELAQGTPPGDERHPRVREWDGRIRRAVARAKEEEVRSMSTLEALSRFERAWGAALHVHSQAVVQVREREPGAGGAPGTR